ncbi:vitamin K epoxide reductase family protein [Arthrobacter stackebrandtii]|nr:vitamin K epoxide reductase family protein [Arthrobacter stackebrandtii]PYG99716.1 hypothetical protein CVV67_13805 [Arthrobacter stackebrandtii]
MRQPTAGPDAEPPRKPESQVPGFARRRAFGVVLLLTGAVGWAASAVLVLERLAMYRNPGHITSCDVNPWVSCGRVMGTWQSELFGFPNPIIGIVAFAIVLATAMAVLAGAELVRWYWLGLQAGVVLGAVLVAWLWSQALFEIYVLCLYCMVVWAAMVPLLVLLTVRNLVHGVIAAPQAVTAFAANWAGTIVAAIYVAIALSVLVRFFPAITGG